MTRSWWGYENPFTCIVYQYKPLRSLEDIETDIKKLEGEILEMLQGVTSE